MERRLSEDRGEGRFASRGGHRQQNYNTSPPSQYAPQSNGYGASDVQRQRHLGPAAAQDPNTNGYMQSPPSDHRNGRPRDTTQNLPIRERSRNDRTSGAMPAGPPAGPTTANKSSTRICKKCGESLTGQFVRALGGTFHLDCFLCRVWKHYLIRLNAYTSC